MKLQTLTLAAALALAGSAFAANAAPSAYSGSAAKPSHTSSLRSDREARPMKKVTLHAKRHHARHLAAAKSTQKREYAFSRHGKQHLAASAHPQRRHVA